MTQNTQLHLQLQKGLAELALAHTADMEAALLSYIYLIKEWSSVYNLTAIRDPEEILRRHILDSAAIIPYLQGQTVLDVGTGAGLPGIPLALLQPQRSYVLLDSNSKKTRFLRHVQQQFGLTNIQIETNRIESFTNEQGFDTIVSRAFTSLRSFLLATKHLIKPHGQFLAMKGQYPETELGEIPPEFNVLGVHKLVVPFLAAERHVVCMSLKQ
jgi:16S rRNA (guanine527-N7)-methyltransferase